MSAPSFARHHSGAAPVEEVAAASAAALAASFPLHCSECSSAGSSCAYGTYVLAQGGKVYTRAARCALSGQKGWGGYSPVAALAATATCVSVGKGGGSLDGPCTGAEHTVAATSTPPAALSSPGGRLWPPLAAALISPRPQRAHKEGGGEGARATAWRGRDRPVLPAA